MNNFHLVVIDTTHIQPYIFGSNRLRENIGASYLVDQATGRWACDMARKKAPGINLDEGGAIVVSPIEDHPEQPAEVLYYGGGNFVAMFRSEETARGFTQELTRQVLREAPGLQLLVVIRTFTWEESNAGLAEAVQAVFSALERKKMAHVVSSPLLGLGVTAACRSTGLPAAGFTAQVNDDPESVFPASTETLAKREAAEKANNHLSAMFRSVLDQASYRLKTQVLFPYELDHLGRSREEFSYQAVLHADGNGVGRRFLDLADRFNYDNRLYIDTVRKLSDQIRQAGSTALENALRRLVMAIDSDQKAIIHRTAAGEVARVNLHKSKEGTFLPVRPLVYGGDDMTLVCDGRLGLALALAYQQEFEKVTYNANLVDGKGKATACAGVAVVKVHYPFSQAYHYAESLCEGAKKYRKEIDTEDACLDWHFATSGWISDLNSVRKREYLTPVGSLTQRPLVLGSNIENDLRSWEVVSKGITAFQGKGWWDRRSKVKALREVLRAGPDQVSAFLLKYNEGNPLPLVAEFSSQDLDRKGWGLTTCGYFDAIELIDWYIPLEDGHGNELDPAN